METKLLTDPSFKKTRDVVVPGGSTRKKVCQLMSDGIKLCSWLMSERQEIVFSRQLLKCLTLVDEFARTAPKMDEEDLFHDYNKIQKEIEAVEFWLRHIRQMPYLSSEEYKLVVTEVYELISMVASVCGMMLDKQAKMKAASEFKTGKEQKRGEIFSLIMNRKKPAKKINEETAILSGSKSKKRIYPVREV